LKSFISAGTRTSVPYLQPYEQSITGLDATKRMRKEERKALMRSDI